ncbi:MAG: flagellar basal body rod protein FlgC [Planctomycetes bacterium]|nr:flagellar basal body rod protein FlgC [Planctomycetota bacterium]MCB9884058.1 flagellar basal body rod protein FlgC [Planctomycetota bacterium]
MTDPMRGVFRGFDIATSGLRADLQRAEIISANLTNMHDTGNATNEPYRRQIVTFEEVLDEVDGKGGVEKRAAGVGVARVEQDRSQLPSFYQPGHPDADEKGMVLGSNVDLFQELVDLSITQRSLDANLNAMRTYRTMLQSTIQNMSR